MARNFLYCAPVLCALSFVRRIEDDRLAQCDAVVDHEVIDEIGNADRVHKAEKYGGLRIIRNVQPITE